MATVVTAKGKDIITGRMKGSTPSQAEPNVASWGLNPASTIAAISDVALFAESTETRVSGTSSFTTTNTTNDTYQVAASISATGTRAIKEAALFDSTTKPTPATVASGAAIIGSTTATTLTTNATFSPGNNNYVQIRGEVLKVTAGSGTTSLTVVRAQNGSTASNAITTNDPVTPGNIPGSTSVSGGDMFAHADFTEIDLINGDAIAFTWSIQYS